VSGVLVPDVVRDADVIHMSCKDVVLMLLFLMWIKTRTG
jgi:hypothetical protein